MRELKKPAHLEVGYIVWADASYRSDEHTREQVVEDVDIHTSGIIVKETKTHVSIGLDYYPVDRTFRRVENIPRKMMKSFEKWRR